MIILADSLKAWGTEGFRRVLKQELEHLGVNELPLQYGLTQTSQVSDSGFRVMILSERVHDGHIDARIGVFYTGVIAGCSCADDPTPVDEINEYCELDVHIDKSTGEARIVVSR